MFIHVPIATWHCAAAGMLVLALSLCSAAAQAASDGAADGWPQHPTWTPSWEMAKSTVMMPCNTSGWFDPVLASEYGIADFDWSTGRAIWANRQPMDNAGVLIEQAAMVKAVSPTAHVWVYRK